MARSIVQTEKQCFYCGAIRGLELHHVFFGPNRHLSTKYGCVIWLCQKHHQDHREGVHHNKEMNEGLKMLFQRKLEEKMSREEFIRIFGRSWL